MVLTETKITDHYYFHNRLGYNVVCFPAITTTTGGVQEGVGLVVQDRPQGWSIESTPFHRPKVVICEVFTGVKHSPLIGAYHNWRRPCHYSGTSVPSC